MGFSGKERFTFFAGQNGFTLIETLVSVAILGALGVTLLLGLSTANKGVAISQERVIAENLAKSQFEHIKSQEYIPVDDYNPDDPAKRYEVIDVPANLAGAGYTLEVHPPELVTPAGAGGYELQSLTIMVKRNGSGKLTITFYRTGLSL